jgi:uncharacterized membrane protein
MEYDDTTQRSAELRGNRNRTLAIASVLGAAAVGAVIATQRRRGTGTAAPRTSSRGVHVHEAITVNRPLAEVYRFWHAFENFPTFMSHLESVQTIDDRRSRWRAKGPAGLRVEWEAEIIGDRENEWIAWRSVEGSDVQQSGAVRFEHAPGARGTEVHVQLQYNPPAGVIGRAIARLFGDDPEQQIRDDLRRFKQILETGEIALSDGPGLWRPAQPPERAEDVKALIGVLQ